MRLLQFLSGKEIRLGVKTDVGILDVKEAAQKYDVIVPLTLQDLIADGQGVSKLNSLVNRILEGNSQNLFVSEDKIIYAPAVSNPEKIICVGLNYINHAKETKMEVPSSPILFSKFNNALAAHMETVPIPSESVQIDYEAELVIVMGKTAKNVSGEDALSYVFGYSIGNDISARDLQFKTGQWLLGKTPDGFAPVGPYIVTSDEVNPNRLTVECRVNGEICQQGNTKDMIFNCAVLISYISQYMTLKPGDIIFTGTPDGVIMGNPKEEQIWLKSGDEVTISIERIGELHNIFK